MEYNQRKILVLGYVKEYGPITANELSSMLDLEIHNARTLLRYYFKQGLLSRTTEENYKIYELTEKGEDRLEWLEQHM